jgi:hypothetical protein
MAESLLLEYTEAMDNADVGWGCVDGDHLRSLLVGPSTSGTRFKRIDGALFCRAPVQQPDIAGGLVCDAEFAAHFRTLWYVCRLKWLPPARIRIVLIASLAIEAVNFFH